MYLTIRGARDFDETLEAGIYACAVTGVDVRFRFRGFSYLLRFETGVIVVYKDTVRDARFSVNESLQITPISRDF